MARTFKTLSVIILKERKQAYFLISSGIAIGILSGLLAAFFKIGINHLIAFRDTLGTYWPANILWQWGMPIAYTTFCIVVSILIVKKFAPEAKGGGVGEVEGALSDLRELRWYRVIPVKFFCGILVIGSGFVAGNEGPSIHMGGCVGKMFSKFFRLKSSHAHTLISAGAAAGLSAAFNAPLAGIMFVIEELRPTFNYSFLSMQCVISASVASDIVMRKLMGQNPEITMAVYSSPPLESLWIFLIFGCIYGLIAAIFNKYLHVFLDYFQYRQAPIYWLNVIGMCVLIGVLSKMFPAVTGGGYLIIPKSINMNLPLITLLLIFIVRMGTTWGSAGPGICGGIFIPMLALGTTFGMFFGHLTHYLFPALINEPGMFAIAGMSGLFAAAVGAPLTGIILVGEMTSNFNIMLPVIVTCFSATIVAHILGVKPVYESLLVRTLRIAKETGQQHLHLIKGSKRKIFKSLPLDD